MAPIPELYELDQSHLMVIGGLILLKMSRQERVTLMIGMSLMKVFITIR